MNNKIKCNTLKTKKHILSFRYANSYLSSDIIILTIKDNILME